MCVVLFSETKVGCEYKEFNDHYTQLCSTITDVDTLLTQFVEEKIILPDNQQEINAITEKDKKVQKMMTYISGPLKTGNTEVFYTMLRILEEHGNQATQKLIGEMRKNLSMYINIGYIATVQ